MRHDATRYDSVARRAEPRVPRHHPFKTVKTLSSYTSMKLFTFNFLAPCALDALAFVRALVAASTSKNRPAFYKEKIISWSKTQDKSYLFADATLNFQPLSRMSSVPSNHLGCSPAAQLHFQFQNVHSFLNR